MPTYPEYATAPAGTPVTITYERGSATAWRGTQVLASMGMNGNSQRERNQTARCLTQMVKSENL